MYKLAIIFFALFFYACSNSSNNVEQINKVFDTTYYDTVEKKLIFETDVPTELNEIINEWFTKKIKVNGYDGLVTIKVIKFSEISEDASNEKKITLKLDVAVIIDKPALKSTKTHQLSVEEFGSISGNYSIKDYENIVANTMVNLVNRLNESLSSKN